MEPKTLANLDGNLVPALTPAKPTAVMSPTKEFLNLSSATSREGGGSATPGPATTLSENGIREQQFQEDAIVEEDLSIFPQTPTPAMLEAGGGAGNFSPTTPYYMSEGARLIQQTCPPKQAMQSLFPLSGEIEEQPDESVRQRLLLARRKSLQFAPRVGSPLGKPMGFGL